MLAALTALVLAAAPPQGAPLSFAEALALAEGTPAALSAARALQASREEGARLRPLAGNPQFTLEAGAREAPNLPLGADVTIGVSQPFNLSGQGQARLSAVRVEQAALQARGAATRLARRLEVGSTWLELWAAEHAVTLAQQAWELAHSLLHSLEQAQAQGATTRAEVARAALSAAEFRLALLEAEGTAVELQIELARLLGLGMGALPHAHGSLPETELPPAQALTALLPRAERLPTALARSLEARAERARAAEAGADRGYQLQVGVSAMREFDGARGGLATFTLTPPVLNRGERERTQLLAQAELLEGQAREASSQAAAELARTFHDVEHSREVRLALEQGLVPAAEQEAQLAQTLLQAGEALLLEVLFARRALLQARTRLVRAQATEAEARFRARLLVEVLTVTPENASPGDTSP